MPVTIPAIVISWFRSAGASPLPRIAYIGVVVIKEHAVWHKPVVRGVGMVAALLEYVRRSVAPADGGVRTDAVWKLGHASLVSSSLIAKVRHHCFVILEMLRSATAAEWRIGARLTDDVGKASSESRAVGSTQAETDW